MGIFGNLVLTHGHEVFGATNHARSSAANLNVGYRPDGFQLEHEIERCHFQSAHEREAEHICHAFNGGACQPAFLFLRTPQQRNNRAGLTAFGIFGDLRIRPRKIVGRKGKAGGLVKVETSKHWHKFLRSVGSRWQWVHFRQQA